MYWLVPAWIITVVLAFFIGYWHRGLVKKIETLEQAVTMKADKKPKVKEPVSTFIDPFDEVQNAIYEHDKMMKKLNPDE